MIKVLIPSMPTAEELLPYLRRIDESRVYVNGGQCLYELQDRLEALLHARVAPVANGTLAIDLALRAIELPPGSDVLVPALTFPGTGLAIRNAGHVPVLADCCPLTWQLTPEMAEAIVRERPSIKAVVPVAAFGLPVPADEWKAFHDATHLPLVIDAAGALLQQVVPNRKGIAVCFSLHATKAVGAGEGGAVACVDPALIARVASMASFGPNGTNAKMSEYHAAVALASLAPERLQAKADASERVGERLLET